MVEFMRSWKGARRNNTEEERGGGVWSGVGGAKRRDGY